MAVGWQVRKEAEKETEGKASGVVLQKTLLMLGIVGKLENGGEDVQTMGIS